MVSFNSNIYDGIYSVFCYVAIFLCCHLMYNMVMLIEDKDIQKEVANFYMFNIFIIAYCINPSNSLWNVLALIISFFISSIVRNSISSRWEKPIVLSTILVYASYILLNIKYYEVLNYLIIFVYTALFYGLYKYFMMVFSKIKHLSFVYSGFLLFVFVIPPAYYFNLPHLIELWVSLMLCTLIVFYVKIYLK